MILANLRHRLTPADWDLVHQLAGGAAATTPDALLDAPGLLGALRALPGVRQPSVALFVYVSVRRYLLGVGIHDPRVADYLGALVLEFGDHDRAWRPSPYLHELLAAAGGGDTHAFERRAHLGNVALWLAGLFPDWIAHRQHRRGGPALSYYEALGARGFRMAADHRLARAYDLDDVFDVAADAFPRLRTALNRLADAALFPNVHTPDRLMRQAADAFHYGDA